MKKCPGARKEAFYAITGSFAALSVVSTWGNKGSAEFLMHFGSSYRNIRITNFIIPVHVLHVVVEGDREQ